MRFGLDQVDTGAGYTAQMTEKSKAFMTIAIFSCTRGTLVSRKCWVDQKVQLGFFGNVVINTNGELAFRKI